MGVSLWHPPRCSACTAPDQQRAVGRYRGPVAAQRSHRAADPPATHLSQRILNGRARKADLYSPDQTLAFLEREAARTEVWPATLSQALQPSVPIPLSRCSDLAGMSNVVSFRRPVASAAAITAFRSRIVALWWTGASAASLASSSERRGLCPAAGLITNTCIRHPLGLMP
jgi:hypothetical protein